MATALSFPTITNVTGAPYMPDLSEAANIQTALKYLYFGSTGSATNSNGIYGALYNLYVGNPTLAGNVTIGGDLTVNGDTTTINVSNLLVEDKEIVIGNVASPTNTTANGGGIRLEAGADVDKTIVWDSTNANWTSSENWNLAAGKALRIGAGGSTTNVISGTAAALVVGANASTTIAIGANGGTATILNPTVTLTNATALNINGASPSIVTSSNGTASVFNTNAATINVGNAATTASIANAATTLSIGNTATTAQTVNIGTASTGASTYNLATGATATSVTKTINIGTGGATASTTNITLGATGSLTSTINLNGNVTLPVASKTLTLSATGAAAGPLNFVSGSLPTTSASSAGSIEYDGIAFYATPKVNNTTAGRGLIPTPSTFILYSTYSPATLSVASGGGTQTTEYSMLNNKYLYLAASTQYFVEAYAKIYHSLATGSTGVPTASVTFFLKAPANSSFYIDTVSNLDMATNWTTAQSSVLTQVIEGLGAEISVKSVTGPNTGDTGYSIIRVTGIVITGTTAGNFAPSIRLSATAASSGTTTATAQIGGTSWCQITPISASPSADTNIGGWA